MEATNIEAALDNLRDSLDKLKALLAWEQLKKAEARSDVPPAFRISDRTEDELRDEYSLFLSVSVQIHSVLHDGSLRIPEAKRQRIGRQLAQIEQQVRDLSLHERFCHC